MPSDTASISPPLVQKSIDPSSSAKTDSRGSIVLAIVLLCIAFWGIDLQTITDALKRADYRWIAPLLLLVLVSNLMRAWRWNALIEALPETSRTDTPSLDGPSQNGLLQDDSAGPATPRLVDSLASIMIGYMVNYAAPRMGEVARTANMATQSRLRFSSVFGTVVVERVFDTAVLAIAILSSGVLLIDRMPAVRQQFVNPLFERLAALPATSVAWGSVLTVGLLSALGALLWRSIQNQQSALRQLWTETLQPALVSFKDGFMTLTRSPRRWTIGLTTLAMWGGYLLMAYIPFLMLGIANPYDIGLVDAWILMAIGSLGLLVPSPGGLGSYHYVTIQALVVLYTVPEGPAASYAVLTHAAQLVFYTVAGVVALVHQGSSLSALFRRAPERTDETEDSLPSGEPSNDSSSSPASVPSGSAQNPATEETEAEQTETTSTDLSVSP